MKSTNLEIAHTWNGVAVGADERVALELRFAEMALEVRVDAPFHRDPAPRAPPGSLDGLWEFEVVELFLLGEGQRYLELEFGPFGHYLALGFDGPRQLRRRGLSLEYASEREAGRWTGRASVPAALLPPGLRAVNAYAMHGQRAGRRHLACHPVPGAEPDFHRLDCFGPLPE